MVPFIEGCWVERYCLVFIDDRSREAFIKTLKPGSEVAAATLEVITKEQRRTQASLICLRNDRARTTKPKYCNTFYAKKESVMRLSKDIYLNQVDKLRDSTSPSWTKLNPRLLALCCTLCKLRNYKSKLLM
jgi:hypothetical protein